jgi:hypothetical protein
VKESADTPALKIFLTSVLLIALGLITYRNFFDNYFTAADTFALIETSRIESISDFFRILSEPVMNETGSEVIGLWYRPMYPLSYSLNQALFGLEPYGYQLTNALLHCTVGALVFLFGLAFFGRRYFWTSVLAAVLFISHPVMVETVPATARRPDMIKCLFLLPALLGFLWWTRSNLKNKWALGVSLVSFLLALMAKETALLVVLLVFSRFLLFENWERISFPARTWSSFKRTLPYLIVAFFFFLWRAIVLRVLHGFEGRPIGGYVHRPYGMLSTWMQEGTGGVLEAVGTILRRYLADLFYLIGPAGVFFYEDQNRMITGAAVLLALLIGFYLYFFRKTLFQTKAGKNVIFFGIWLLFPLGICLVMHYYSMRNLYMSLIAFCLLTALLLVKSGQYLSGSTQGRFPEILKTDKGKAVATGFLVLVLTVVSLLAFSPLWHEYGEWKASGELSQNILEEIEKLKPQLPTDAELHFHDFPARIRSFRREVPHVLSVTPLVDFSVKSWLDIHYPDNRMTVTIENVRDLEEPAEISLEIESRRGKEVHIRTVPGPDGVFYRLP